MTSNCSKLTPASLCRSLVAASLLAGACLSHSQELQADSQHYTQAVRAFANTVLEHGRD